jgi:hypothetical protein
MRLKIRRSQRDSGVMSSTVVFCLDVRVEFTPVERSSLQRYKLYNQVIYNSEASRRYVEKSAAQQDGTTIGSVKGLASLALAAMRLNVSVKSLERGQHIECKSMDEVIGAENAIMTACQNLKEYLETARQFDGGEHVVDFSTGTPTVVAQSRPAESMVEPPPLPEESGDTAFDRDFVGSSRAESYEPAYSSSGAEDFGKQVRDAFQALRNGETLTTKQWQIVGATALIVLILFILIFR